MRETCVDLQSQDGTACSKHKPFGFQVIFEKRKTFNNNFNDWFARLKLVLRVEKKLYVIEQPLPPALMPVAMALPVQNINHSAFRSMFEKEKLSGNNFNDWKTIGEIHAMLIEYEKGLPKKAETPQVMMIKGGKIQKANKKSLNAKG
ncbi:hypothetical protein Tco_1021333 [Tanacetum coccineum]